MHIVQYIFTNVERYIAYSFYRCTVHKTINVFNRYRMTGFQRFIHGWSALRFKTNNCCFG